jgi:hypothetical protein
MPGTAPPANSCREHYAELQAGSARVLETTLGDPFVSVHASALAQVSDLTEWLTVLDARRSYFVPPLQASVRELQFGLLLVAQGHYRQAFAALRFVLEHTLAAVAFSSNELEFRLWQADHYDITWGHLSGDEGVLSQRFVLAFGDEDWQDVAREFRERARIVYRNCSQYVHGNASTAEDVPSVISFSEVTFRAWHEACNEVMAICHAALAIRFLTSFTETELAALEPVLLEYLGDREQFRRYLEAEA